MNKDIMILSRVLTSQMTSIQALYLMWTATKDKIGEYYDIQWYDPTLGRRDNKDRMKELGGALNSLRSRLFELQILGTAKVVEDALYDLNAELDTSLSFWNLPVEPKCYQTVVFVRCLANIIKHQHSYVIDGAGRDTDRLILEFDVPSDSRIGDLDLTRSDYPQLGDPILLLHHTDVCVRDLTAKTLGLDIPVEPVPDKEVHTFMEQNFSPEAIRELKEPRA